MTELNSKNFNDFIKSGNCIVDFWAEWCGPCKMMAPFFEKAAFELSNKIKFGKLNIDKASEIAQDFGVMSIPTLILFKNGEIIDQVSGALMKEEIIDLIKKNFE